MKRDRQDPIIEGCIMYGLHTDEKGHVTHRTCTHTASDAVEPRAGLEMVHSRLQSNA